MIGGVSKAAEEGFVTGMDESARDADERRAFPNGVPESRTEVTRKEALGAYDQGANPHYVPNPECSAGVRRMSSHRTRNKL